MGAAPEVIELPSVRAGMAEVGRLFDQYRRHYGQAGDQDAGATWLTAQLSTGGLRGFAALLDRELAGLALVAAVPASQRLGHFWVLRDLYVAGHLRRRGVAKALLRHLQQAARAQGALRLSLTTEADNVAALALYRSLGFEPVLGYTSLSVRTERT